MPKGIGRFPQKQGDKMKKDLNIAVIGCGMRGRNVISIFQKELKERLKIQAVYDSSQESLALAAKCWKMPNLKSEENLEKAINNPNVDVVMIFTPNACHCQAILAALAAGKKVFSEKPLATNLEDCKRIMEAERASGITIMTGFVLRYSPLYRKIKELLDSGSFGKIINIAASENRNSFGGGHSMCADYGWRRFRDKAGPYLLEKCSHDLDLLNWFADSVPERAAAFCGLNYFVPANQYIWDKYDKHNFDRLVISEDHIINPFLSEKDIFDNHSVIFEYPNGVKASFQLTLANAIPERRMYISCTEGTIIAEAFSGIIKYKHYDDPYSVTLNFVGDGHAGGDAVMVHELSQALLAGRSISVSGSSNGLDCARAALAADKAAQTGRIVELSNLI